MAVDNKPAIAGQVADAVPGNWVDRWAPEPMRPYFRLSRFDRPIGVWLLLWPCWWSAALAALANARPFPNIWHLGLFAVGALVMRAAGCTYNDLVDRDYDARVARTKSRPIPSGQISPRQAQIFMIGLALCGFFILLQFNLFTIVLGIASLPLITLYPFMKRFTSWPQCVLGLVFAWGALMGWAATFGGLDWPAVLLYGATVAWIVGYDTIYAHQDKEDDALVGLKSTALRFGEKTKPWLTLIYGLAAILLLAAGLTAGAGPIFLFAWLATTLHFAWQIITLDTNDPVNCLTRFRSNHYIGAIIFLGLLADIFLNAVL